MNSRCLPLLPLLLTPLWAAQDPGIGNAFRQPQKNGWTFVHLEGTPSEIGFQHGSLLAAEIEDSKRAIELSTTHDLKHSWAEMRTVSQNVLLPHLPAEYRSELEGIVAGLAQHGSKLDLLDLVSMNAFMEMSYYYDELSRHHPQAAPVPKAERCSAFVATGSYTRDGRIVIGHNNWSDYLSGSRWDIIFDVQPASGHRFVMDGVAGLIHSGDDFGINDAGIMITETTISDFHGFDTAGVPEFARARQALQYAESIDDFARIMKDGNNGGYANTWLVADRKTNEIARLELGLKNVTLDRSKDGYFVGSNFPINAKLIAEETTYPTNDPNISNEARHRRWEQLMAEYKGKIDVAAGQKFETDHYDVVTKEIDPNERTLCGHVDRSSRGVKGWMGPYGAAGAVEAKVADSAMAEKLSFIAGAGKPCGVAFAVKPYLREHKEYDWQASLLQDLNTNAWTVFQAGTGGQ